MLTLYLYWSKMIYSDLQWGRLDKRGIVHLYANQEEEGEAVATDKTVQLLEHVEI